MHQNNPLLKWLGFRPTGDLGGLTSYTTRRNKTTWFNKSPPKTAPSPRQRVNRAHWRTIALAWHTLTPDQQQTWKTAVNRAHLAITGYSLWLWFWCHLDLAPIRTIERHTDLQLPGLP